MVFDSVRGASIVRGNEEKFEDLREQVLRELPGDEPGVNKSRIADIALAVGITEETKGEVETPDVEFSIDTLDKHDIMKVIIEERNPDAEGSELREAMQGYLNGGLEIIAEDMDENGLFRYHRYLPDSFEED